MFKNKSIPKGSRIAIVGQDKFSQQIVSEIILKHTYEVVCFIGENSGIDIMTIPVVSFEEAKKKIGEFIDAIVCIEEMPYTDENYFKMRKIGFSSVYVLHKESHQYFESSGEFSRCALQWFDLSGKALMRYLETHLIDSCNLNCNGCTHFANLHTANSEVSIESFKADMEQLSRLFNISILRLMGGEPLLCKDIIDFICIARTAFPNSKIFIVTNGLLIPQLTDDICGAISQNDIALNITIYPPTAKQIVEIGAFLRAKGIEHYYGAGNREFSESMIIRNFHKCLRAVKNGVQDDSAAKKCFNRYCWFLRNGKLSKCAFPLLIDVVEKRFSKRFPKRNEDVIDIFQIINAWSVINKLNQPMFFCRNCSPAVEKFAWIGNCMTPMLNDYCVSEETL